MVVNTGRTLVILGVVLIVFGLALILAGRIPFFRATSREYPYPAGGRGDIHPLSHRSSSQSLGHLDPQPFDTLSPQIIYLHPLGVVQ